MNIPDNVNLSDKTKELLKLRRKISVIMNEVSDVWDVFPGVLLPVKNKDKINDVLFEWCKALDLEIGFSFVNTIKDTMSYEEWYKTLDELVSENDTNESGDG